MTQTYGDGEARKMLAVCGSRKPPPGSDARSAARELLRAVVAGAEQEGTACEWLDVRDVKLPLFDGRSLADYGDPELARVADAFARHSLLVLSVPAYWGGPAGVVKNLLDLVGGAAYDAPPDVEPPLAGKVAALLVVGADPLSADVALASLRTTLAAMGAWVAPRAHVIGNPRAIRDPAALVRSLTDFGAYVASLVAPVAVPA